MVSEEMRFNTSMLPLFAALTCPSYDDWMQLLEEVLMRSAGYTDLTHDDVWEAILDALVENIAEA